MLQKSVQRMAGRLLFLQHHCLLHLLVANKHEWRQEWQKQHGLLATRRAPGEPQLISLADIATLPDAQFASLPAVASGGGQPALRAFIAELQSNTACQELQAAAAAERARLVALLPKQLRQAAQQRLQAAGQGEKEEGGSMCLYGCSGPRIGRFAPAGCPAGCSESPCPPLQPNIGPPAPATSQHRQKHAAAG